jgi:hypothetical protein
MVSYAETGVCSNLRPNWEPGTTATTLNELVALMSTPPSLILLVATALVVRLRHQWGALVVVLAWTAWMSTLTLGTPAPLTLQATAEGCIGSSSLFITTVIALCVATILHTTRGAKTPPTTEK